MLTTDRQFQLRLNNIPLRSVENGFNFLNTKQFTQTFVSLRILHNDPDLRMNGDHGNL